MTIFLNYILLSKCFNRCWVDTYLQISGFSSGYLKIILIYFLVIILSLISKVSTAQTLHFNYTIQKGGDDIGWLKLEKSTNGNRSNMSLTYEIKTRIIFLITAIAKDSSTFENGKLVYSSLFKKLNNDTKLDKQTRLVADKYEVLESGKKKNLATSFIGINLLSLYFQEPVGVNTVYCDMHNCFVPIIKTSDGGYKIKKPDGNSNTFYYTKGVCIKIIFSQSLYTAIGLLNLK